MKSSLLSFKKEKNSNWSSIKVSFATSACGLNSKQCIQVTDAQSQFRTHKDSATANVLESYLICTRPLTSLKLRQQNIKGRKQLDTEMETTTVALVSLPSVYSCSDQSVVHSTIQSRGVQSPTFTETLL